MVSVSFPNLSYSALRALDFPEKCLRQMMVISAISDILVA